MLDGNGKNNCMDAYPVCMDIKIANERRVLVVDDD